jgi:hypothetical protein
MSFFCFSRRVREMCFWQSAQNVHYILYIPQAHKSPSFGFRIAGALPRLFSNCAGRRGIRTILYTPCVSSWLEPKSIWLILLWLKNGSCVFGGGWGGDHATSAKASRCVQINKYSQTACQYQISIKWLNLSLRRKTKTKQGWKKIDPGS